MAHAQRRAVKTRSGLDWVRGESQTVLWLHVPVPRSGSIAVMLSLCKQGSLESFVMGRRLPVSKLGFKRMAINWIMSCRSLQIIMTCVTRGGDSCPPSLTLYGVGVHCTLSMGKGNVFHEKVHGWGAASGLRMHVSLLHYLRRSCFIDFPSSWLEKPGTSPTASRSQPTASVNMSSCRVKSGEWRHAAGTDFE